MKKWIAALCILALSLTALSGCTKRKEEEEIKTIEDQAGDFSSGEEDEAEDLVPITLNTDQALTGIHHATMEVEGYGTISMELDADVAPITVTNFVKLVQEGFYDGLTFHRIISGFMIQGGDPLGNGTGNSGESIKGEFSSNGVENSISHSRGTISMARSNDPDSASCQFFIMHGDAAYLDGNYAAFGHVISGMDVVDKICDDAVPVDSNGSIEKEKQPKISSIVITD